MTLASNNPYPSVLLVEGSVPASPSAGDQRLYLDTADHQVKRVNSSGAISVVDALTLIGEYVASGSTSVATFSAIPGTYRGLKIVAQLRASGAVVDSTGVIGFNSDTGTNYQRQNLVGNNATASASAAAVSTSAYFCDVPGASATANIPAQAEATIWNYAGTTFYKTVQSQEVYFDGTGAANCFVALFAGLWKNTAAITRIDITCGNGNFVSGSKVALYGIF